MTLKSTVTVLAFSFVLAIGTTLLLQTDISRQNEEVVQRPSPPMVAENVERNLERIREKKEAQNVHSDLVHIFEEFMAREDVQGVVAGLRSSPTPSPTPTE